MDNGYTMNDVDDLDIIGYLDIKSYGANKNIETQIQALDAAGL